MRSRRVATETGDLYVEEHGDGDPLLLIQGLGQGLWAWREQVPAFARSYMTIAFDLRGTGRSSRPPGPYRIADLAGDAADVLDGRAARVVGLSMGGYIALTLALERPELVRSLVLVSTGAGGSDRTRRPLEVRDAFLDALARPYEEYARATMPYTFAPGWAEANRERYDEILAVRLENPATHETVDAHGAACQRFYDEGCEVESMQAPALVVHGDTDRILPVENGRTLAARLPNARYVELPGAGHNLPLEDPETFNQIVLDFLR